MQSQSSAQGHRAEKPLHWDLTDSNGKSSAKPASELAINSAQECIRKYVSSDEIGNNEQATGTETAIGSAPECQRKCTSSEELGNNDQATESENANVGDQVSVS
jgi:hypothetical protein